MNPNPKEKMRRLEEAIYPSADSAPQSPSGILKTDKILGYTVNLDSFLATLPLSVLSLFVRQRLWIPDLTAGNTFPINDGALTTNINLFSVPARQSLLITYISQTWLQASDPPTPLPPAVPAGTNSIYTALPTTAGISGAAPFTLTVNNSPVMDVSGSYSDTNIPTTSPVVASGFVDQQTNFLNFGIHRNAVIVDENQDVGVLYSATYGVPVNATERPDAIFIEVKGFLAPTQIIQQARRIYGI